MKTTGKNNENTRNTAPPKSVGMEEPESTSPGEKTTNPMAEKKRKQKKAAKKQVKAKRLALEKRAVALEAKIELFRPSQQEISQLITELSEMYESDEPVH